MACKPTGTAIVHLDNHLNNSHTNSLVRRVRGDRAGRDSARRSHNRMHADGLPSSAARSSVHNAMAPKSAVQPEYPAQDRTRSCPMDCSVALAQTLARSRATRRSCR